MEALIVQNIIAGPRAGMKLADEERIGDGAWWKRERNPLVATGKHGVAGRWDRDSFSTKDSGMPSLHLLPWLWGGVCRRLLQTESSTFAGVFFYFKIRLSASHNCDKLKM